MNQSSVALPKRLLRIRRQTARLAELRCMRAAAQLEQAVQAEKSKLAEINSADQQFRSRCLNLKLVEEVYASQREMQKLDTELRACGDALAAARTEYETAVKERTTADGEVEVLEKLLERRLEELARKAERRKQQFADEWTMRRWTGTDADRQEAY